MAEDIEVQENFPLFSRSSRRTVSRKDPPPPVNVESAIAKTKVFEKERTYDPTSTQATFSDLGLADWAVSTCKELAMKRPTPVQRHCISRILAGENVMARAETGSGKTAAFALPIIQRISENPFGVFALVLTPARELAYQLAEQFRALGSSIGIRCAVIVGGMGILDQTLTLLERPHVVIGTPGRIKVQLETPDVPAVFSNTKFLVLDEADRVLDVNFESELRVIFNCLPKNRQTLLFSATMTSNLQALHELSANKSYFYEEYEGFKTVKSLREQYLFIPKTVKEVYLIHVLNRMKEMRVRSTIIFVSTCRSCELLSLMLQQLKMEVAALHSVKSQSLRLSALHKFKSEQVRILIATDVASRGLDIPTVDLVINYDIPRCPDDYLHRVGRTARAGRGGIALSIVTQNDVELVHQIESAIGKKLDKFEYKENEVNENISKVYKARRVATMKMLDDGFEEKMKSRKEQKQKTLIGKNKRKRKQMQ